MTKPHRQKYGLGSIIKKAAKAVKKVVKSPIGKAALAGAAIYGLGGGTFMGRTLPTFGSLPLQSSAAGPGGFGFGNILTNVGRLTGLGSGGLDLGTSNIVRLEGATATKTSTASAMVDSFSSSTYQSASYQVQVRRGNDYHTTSINLVHANDAVYLSEYGTVITNESLATFDADIDSGNVRLKAAPTSSDSTVFKIFRTVMNS